MQYLQRFLLATFLTCGMAHQASAIPVAAGDILALPQLQTDVPAPPELRGAFELAQRGDIEQAVDQLESFVAAHPDSAAGVELLGAMVALRGDTRRAIRLLKRALRINKDQTTAHTKLGDIFLAEGELDRAELSFRAAVATPPGDPRAHQRLGLLAEEQGDVDTAISHYRAGIRGTAPGYVGIKLNLARLYNRQARFSDTQALLGPMATNMTDARALIALGTSYLSSGSAAHGMQLFQKAKQHEPDYEGTHLSLGIGYRQLNELEKSIAAFDDAIAIAPQWPIAHWQRGDTLMQMGRRKQALESYQNAANYSRQQSGTLDPMAGMRVASAQLAVGNEAQALASYAELDKSGQLPERGYLAYGQLLEQAGSIKEAEALYDRWLEHQSGALAYQHAARIRAAQGQYQSADRLLRKANTHFPANADLLWLHATTLQRLGDDRAAIRAARESITLAPSISRQFFLASVLDSDGQRPEAEQQYQSILKTEPEHAGALNNLAVIRTAQRRYEEALSLAQKAAVIAPDDPFIIDTLGWALFKSSQPEQAREVLEKAASDELRYAPLFYHLAMSQFAIGDKDAARRSVARALNISSDFPEREAARELLKRL